MTDQKVKVKIFEYFSKSPSSNKSKSPITVMPKRRTTRLKSEIFLENLSSVTPDGEYDIQKENFDLPMPKTPETYKTPTKTDLSAIQSIPAGRRSQRLKTEVLDRSSLLDLSRNDEGSRLNSVETYPTPPKCYTNVMKSLPARRTTRLKSEVLDRSFLKNLTEDNDSTRLESSETNKTPSKSNTSDINSLTASRRSTRLKSQVIESSLKDLSGQCEPDQSKISETYKTPIKNKVNILQSESRRKRSTNSKSGILDRSLSDHHEPNQSVTSETYTTSPKNDSIILQSKAARKRSTSLKSEVFNSSREDFIVHDESTKSKTFKTPQKNDKNDLESMPGRISSEVLENNSPKDFSQHDESATSKPSETCHKTPSKKETYTLQLLKPKRRSTRLKSEVVDRNLLKGLTECESVITGKPVDNMKSEKFKNEKNLDALQNSDGMSGETSGYKPTKKKNMDTQENINITDKDSSVIMFTNNQVNVTKANPARRLTRLRSVVIDRSCLNNAPDENSFTTLKNESNLKPQDIEVSDNENLRKRAKKRKMSNQEMTENMLETIDTSGIADMTIALDKGNISEQSDQSQFRKKRKLYHKDNELLHEFSPEKYENYIRQKQANQQTDDCNDHLLNERSESVIYDTQSCENSLEIQKSSKQTEDNNIHLRCDKSFSASKTNYHQKNSKNVTSPKKNDKNGKNKIFRDRRKSIKIINSELIDGLNNLDITSQTSGTEVDTNELQNLNKDVKLKKRSKKRKLSCQKLAENLIETIDANAIADMLMNTDKEKINELANDTSIPNKNLTQTENSINEDNTHLNTEESKPSRNNSREKIPRKRQSSKKVASNELLNDSAQINKNSDELINSPQTATENISPQKHKNNSLNANDRHSNFFKDLNSSYEEIASRKRQNSNKVKNNKSLNDSLSQTSKQKSIMSYFKAKNKKSTENSNSSKLCNNEINAKQSTKQPMLDSGKLNKENSLSDQKPATVTAKKRGRPRLENPKPENRYIKLKKLRKEHIKTVKERKIPEEHLNEVLSMMDDDDHPMWEDRNISCNPYIFQHWKRQQTLISDQNIKLKLARQFILRRDWMNLSKVLGLFNASAKNYYPLLAKYAALLLGYTDKEQFVKFIQFLTKSTDSSAVIKKCTTMSTDNVE